MEKRKGVVILSSKVDVVKEVVAKRRKWMDRRFPRRAGGRG